ncbi:hypothetical protein BGW41_004485 [Actinomortierella wolfii]|nr:hypothetical protein BGW41_004485 [Actinomortierella wolfii]
MSAADRAASVMDEGATSILSSIVEPTVMAKQSLSDASDADPSLSSSLPSVVATTGSLNTVGTARTSLASSSSTTMPLASATPITSTSANSLNGTTTTVKAKTSAGTTTTTAAATTTTSTTVPSSLGSASGAGTLPASPKKKLAKKLANASLNSIKPSTIRINFSLSENPNAIISFSDLFRQDQKRRIIAEQKQQIQQQIQQAKHALSSSSKKEAKAAASTGSAASATPASLISAQPMEVDSVEPSASSAVASTSANGSSVTPKSSEPSGIAEGESDDGEEEASDDDEDDAEAEEEEEEASDDDDDDDDDDEAEDDEGDDDDDDEVELRERPGDFLEALAAKYAALEEFENDGEDEDDDDEEEDVPRTHKKPSRWDTERYDVEDEFIDDSEMMLEDIGMVKPKIEGFFVYRGPVETTVDEKSSNLSIVERANDSVSEMSEADDSKTDGASSKKSSGKDSTADKDSVDASEGSARKKAAGSRAKSNLSKEVMPSQKSATSATKDQDATTSGGGGASTSAVTPSPPVTGTSGASVDKTTSASTAKRKAKAKATVAANGVDSENESSVKINKSKSADAEPIRDSPVDQDTTMMDVSHDTEVSFSSDAGADAVDEASLSGSNAKAVGHGKSPSPSKVTTTTATPNRPESAPKPKTKAGSKDVEKKKPSKPAAPLTAEVQRYLNIIADLAKKETWEVKNKFPPHIKPPLWEATKAALRDRSSGYLLDESFIEALMDILPYNRFTIRKLLYRNVLPVWIPELEEQKKKLEEKFDQQVKRVWKESGYEEMEKKRQQEQASDGDVVMKSEDVAADGSDDQVKPTKRFPWTQELRLVLWEVMEKHMEILAAMAQLHVSDPSFPMAPSESKTRKDAYQVLVASFPPGWETTYGISRQYSQLKEKVTRQKRGEQAANGGDHSGNSGGGGTNQRKPPSNGEGSGNRGGPSGSRPAVTPAPTSKSTAPPSNVRPSAPTTTSTSEQTNSSAVQAPLETSRKIIKPSAAATESTPKSSHETIHVLDDDDDVQMQDVETMKAEPGGTIYPGTTKSTVSSKPMQSTHRSSTGTSSAPYMMDTSSNRPPPGRLVSQASEQQSPSMSYQHSYQQPSYHRVHGQASQQQSSIAHGSSSPTKPVGGNTGTHGSASMSSSVTTASGRWPSSSAVTASDVPFEHPSTTKKRKNSREEQYIANAAAQAAVAAAAAAKESAAYRAAQAQQHHHRSSSPSAPSSGRPLYDDRGAYGHHVQQQQQPRPHHRVMIPMDYPMPARLISPRNSALHHQAPTVTREFLSVGALKWGRVVAAAEHQAIKLIHRATRQLRPKATIGHNL